MKLKVSPLKLWQLCEFMNTARPLDLLECYHASNEAFRDTLVNEFNNTYCLYDADAQEVYAIWGVDKEEIESVIWMLCTDKVEEKPITFLRYCKKYIEGLLDQHPLMHNYVWLGNYLHVKWLKWMGARFGEIITRNGEPFQYFYFMKE